MPRPGGTLSQQSPASVIRGSWSSRLSQIAILSLAVYGFLRQPLPMKDAGERLIHCEREGCTIAGNTQMKSYPFLCEDDKYETLILNGVPHKEGILR